MTFVKKSRPGIISAPDVLPAGARDVPASALLSGIPQVCIALAIPTPHNAAAEHIFEPLF
ncbi:hypothetical protein ACPAVH_30675 [Enterobacteriaceae bacterium TYF_5]